MWYALLPFAALYTGFLYAPHLVNEVANRLFNNGHPQGRRMHLHPWDFISFYRDERLAGDMYHARGLECIPDK